MFLIKKAESTERRQGEHWNDTISDTSIEDGPDLITNVVQILLPSQLSINKRSNLSGGNVRRCPRDFSCKPVPDCVQYLI